MEDTYKKKEINLTHFKDLVAMASADGKLDEKEKKFLYDKATEYGLPVDEVKVIIENSNNVQFSDYKDVDNKEQHLADIVFMAMIDGELKKEEYGLCLQIAEKMELTKKDVDRIIIMIKNMYSKKN